MTTSRRSYGAVGLGLALLAGAAVFGVGFTASDSALGELFHTVGLDGTRRPMRTDSIAVVRRAFLALAVLCAIGAALVWWFRGAVNQALAWLRADFRRFWEPVAAAPRSRAATLERAEWIALGILAVLALAVRLHFSVQPVSYDEAINYVEFVSRSWWDVVSDYHRPNNHVFHTLLAHVTSPLGTGEASVRLPALIAGLLTIVATYWLTSRLFGRQPALLAAGLMAVAPVSVEYSAQARGYTLVTLLFLSAFIIATLLRDRPTLTGWVLLTVSFTLALYTIPTALLSVGVVCAWLLITVEPARRLKTALAVGVVLAATATLAVILYTPIMLRWGVWSLFWNKWLTPHPWSRLFMVTVHELMAAVACWVCPLPLWSAAPIAAVSGSGFTRSTWRRAWPLLVALAVGIVPIILVRRVVPPQRTLAWALPIVLAILACGLWGVFERFVPNARRRAIWAGTIVIVALVLAGGHVARDTPDDWVADFPAPPGADGIACCAEGFFVDAKDIAVGIGAMIGEDDAIIAHRFSGGVETIGFYLLRAGHPRTHVLSFDHGAEGALEALAALNRAYVVVKRPYSLSSEPADVFSELRLAPADLDTLFGPLVHVESYVASDVYVLRRLGSAAADR